MNTTTRNCVFCNKVFYPLTAEVKRGRGLVCSPACRYKRHSQLLLGHKMKPEAKEKLIKALTGRKRSESHSKNISKSLIGKYGGELNGNWRGGTYMSQGRWYTLATGHSLKHQNGYIFRSRFVAEQTIGRYLTRQENVHHINFQKDDDRTENLYLFASDAEHTAYHQLVKAGKLEPITESNLSSC